MYMELPYVGNSTKVFYKKINYFADKIRPDIEVRFILSPPAPSQTFFQTEDSIPKHLQSEIVYSAKCENCNHNYVGKTERQSVRRLCEHGASKEEFDKFDVYPLDTGIEEDNSESRDRIHHSLSKRRTKSLQTQPSTPGVTRSSRLLAKTHTVDNPVSKAECTDEGEKDTIKKSALAKHESETGHKIDWMNFKILWSDKNPYRLLIKESLVIKAYELHIL
ncbi:unnamed protein product [Didymodactylos carnosus]|uniref:Uncharacterized protein n=1 Tax=Didymodactylos carnosus TaxID=1234261 RepID=A0A814Y5S7_9BILA|nr:unnamed protein product [Didymodactylos carnosus]CAF1225027.1 unnamed protein product [Didymodactylos carnosus]CAF3795904.1 unnamed protein product [Didymodactylos carnosus]CAF3987983.1 unnamed protein product [Didymodactylos carnosus]